MWFVYLLICSDNTIYTGITNNLNNRLKAHNSGMVKYTRGRRPVKFHTWFCVDSKSIALKYEYKIKQLTRRQKLSIENFIEYFIDRTA
jgi:putative endonuclease